MRRDGGATNMKEFIFHKSYQSNIKLRRGFNKLVEKTFCLNFENWYQHGYWKDQFNQYTLFDGEEAVSNVSAYTMDFDWNGTKKHVVQLGGVATDEQYRKQGLNRKVLEAAIKDYENKVDDILLLANHTVVDFYPKFGFHRCRQWQCSKDVYIATESSVVPVSMSKKQNWKDIEEAIMKSVSNSALEMKRNPELIMFYLTQYMQENVYYIEKLNTYVVAEIEENELTLSQVFAPEVIDLDKVYEAFGKEIKHVKLEFTPLNPESYVQTEILDPDDNLFVMGKDVELFEKQKVMIPILAHT